MFLTICFLSFELKKLFINDIIKTTYKARLKRGIIKVKYIDISILFDSIHTYINEDLLEQYGESGSKNNIVRYIYNVSPDKIRVDNEKMYVSDELICADFVYRYLKKTAYDYSAKDIANLASATYTIDGNNYGGATIDFSGVTTVGDVTFTAKSAFKGIKLPTGYDLASYSGPQTFAFYVDGSDAYLKIIDADNGLEDVKKLSVSCSWANAPVAGKTVYLSGNYGDFETAKAFLKNGANAGATDVIKVVPVSNDPYTVDGCNVTINMAKAEGKTFAQVLSEAKAAMTAADATQTHICTLTVVGELGNNDLAILGDAVMTGASRIDLSGATLASGASIDNLQLPSSLTSLILPKNQTVSSVLAGKLEAAGNVNYAYSPSSDAQRLGASSTGSILR